MNFFSSSGVVRGQRKGFFSGGGTAFGASGIRRGKRGGGTAFGAAGITKGQPQLIGFSDSVSHQDADRAVKLALGSIM